MVNAKLKGIAGVVVIFLVGAAAGWIVARHSYRERLEGLMRGNPEAFHEVIVRRLNKKLNLEPDQVNKLREILNQSHEEVAAAHEDLTPEIQEILEETKSRVESILTPSQAVVFRQMTEKERATTNSIATVPPPSR